MRPRSSIQHAATLAFLVAGAAGVFVELDLWGGVPLAGDVVGRRVVELDQAVPVCLSVANLVTLPAQRAQAIADVAQPSAVDVPLQPQAFFPAKAARRDEAGGVDRMQACATRMGVVVEPCSQGWQHPRQVAGRHGRRQPKLPAFAARFGYLLGATRGQAFLSAAPVRPAIWPQLLQPASATPGAGTRRPKPAPALAGRRHSPRW